MDYEFFGVKVIPGIAVVQDVLKVLFEVKLGVKCDA